MTAAARPEAPTQVELARAGDPAARRALVEELGPLVLGMCRRATADPDDAFQGVCERIFHALPRFDPHGSAKLSTWVATIAHRHLIDLSRRGRTRAQVLTLPRTAPPGPETELLHKDEAAQLDRAIGSLPPCTFGASIRSVASRRQRQHPPGRQDPSGDSCVGGVPRCRPSRKSCPAGPRLGA